VIRGEFRPVFWNWSGTKRAIARGMAGVTRYEDLLVYRLADRVRLRVRPIVERPAFARHWKLRDQLSESAESACPCIAEGFSRFNPRENANLVRTARASLTEVNVHMGRALALRLVDQREHDEIVALATRAVQASTRYINYLDTAEIPGTPPPRRREPRRPRTRDARKPPVEWERETDTGGEDQEL
jgi:four helix bundle protein